MSVVTSRVRSRGFTLIELAFVLGIISVVAAAAVPGYQAILQRSRAGEARELLHVIAHAELAHLRDRGAFLACPPEPAQVPAAAKVAFDGGKDGWKSLGFKPDGAVRYQYEVVLVDGGYMAIARGDLDGDGQPSEFVLDGRTGRITATEELE